MATAVHLSSSERRTLLSGAPVTRILDGVDASKEVAVFGAVWINASPSTYVQRVKDIENFERGGGFRITIQDRGDATVIASKMLYASHYFWTALETRTLMPDASRGSGFWFITVNRSRSDGLSGFLGRLIRGRVRNEARKGTLAALTATKTSLEATAR